MKIVTLYDDNGRIKLPKDILKMLKVRKGDKLAIIPVDGELAVKLIPINELLKTVKWPVIGDIDEDKALSEKVLALYDVI